MKSSLAKMNVDEDSIAMVNNFIVNKLEVKRCLDKDYQTKGYETDKGIAL